MLRISRSLESEGVVVKLEGRLAGPWVSEAERVWRAAIGRGVPIGVDLSEITYADDAGRELLAKMHAQGSRLIATTFVTRGIVDDLAVARDRAPCGSGIPCNGSERESPGRRATRRRRRSAQPRDRGPF